MTRQEQWLLGVTVFGALGIVWMLVWALSHDPTNVCQRAGFLLGETYQGHIYCSVPIPPPMEGAVKIR